MFHIFSALELPPLPPLPFLPPLPPPPLSSSVQIITKNSSKPKIEAQQQVYFKNPSNSYMTIMKGIYDPQPETIIRNIHNLPTSPVRANQESLHVIDRDEFCQSPQCVISASKMERLIDWKADPCENFYQFACGRFVRDSTLHDRRDSLNIFTMTDDKLKDQLRRLFERKIENGESEAYRNVKELFKSCMNTDEHDERGIDPLRELIGAVGGWPMLADSNWNENTWDLEKSILMLRKYMSMGADTNNIFRRIFQMRGIVNRNLPFGSLNENTNAPAAVTVVDNDKMQKSFLKFEHILDAFKSYLIDISMIIGANKSDVEPQIDDALKFEKELIKLNTHVVVDSGLVANAFVNETYVKYSLTQWMDLFYSLPFPANALAVDNENSKMLNKIKFLQAFEDLLSKTSKRTLANYFVLRIIAFSSPHMTSAMKKIQLNYTMKLLGVKQKEEVWKGCVNVISNALHLAVESMFSQEYFDLESKQTAIDIAMRIKNIFENRLVSLPWINLQQRAQILFKMNKIIAALLFPKEMLSEREVNLFYRNVSIQPEKYLEALLNLQIFNADRMFLRKQLGFGTEFENSGSVGVLNYVDVKDFNKICT
jgi:neprilysin